MDISKSDTPFGRIFGELAKEYVGIFTRSLEHLSISRYFYALVVIDNYKGDLSQTTLGDELYLDKASVVRMLDYLEQNKCIKRCPNPSDRRAHILHLTDKARKMIPDIKQAIHNTNTLCMSKLTGKNTIDFEAELDTVRQGLQGEPKRNYKLHFVKSED